MDLANVRRQISLYINGTRLEHTAPVPAPDFPSPPSHLRTSATIPPPPLVRSSLNVPPRPHRPSHLQATRSRPQGKAAFSRRGERGLQPWRRRGGGLRHDTTADMAPPERPNDHCLGAIQDPGENTQACLAQRGGREHAATLRGRLDPSLHTVTAAAATGGSRQHHTTPHPLIAQPALS
ncbi:hypothetical protein NDU88_006407 [Pleurodeles waltl]|uniref:Uncharacterized protein n=1 Tax=Pleurodeles waltl TaxID=8319 RepID=A0AAV7UKX4_PLEWA|nr:hypothetical protein NDU88_006407 [Pleurodeles waltl]